MITEAEYIRLKKEVDQARAEAERAKGALDQVISRLRDEFQCENLKQAKTLLQDLSKKRDLAREKLEKALKDYEERWKR